MTNGIAPLVPVFGVTENQLASMLFLARLKAATCYLSVALLLLFASYARGACLHWEKVVDRPGDSTVYAGALGDHQIRMMLHLNVTTGLVDGTYGYSDERGVLMLTGYMRPAGDGADFVERNEEGRVTGNLSVAFFQPRSNWGGSWEFFKSGMKQSPSECSFLTGIWQPEPWDGNPGQLVSLQYVGSIDPSNNAARLKNEATAYEFMQAVLHGDKKKIVSLLHYPFHSYDNSRKGQRTKTWTTPESVLKNYGKLIKLNKYQRRAVPHMLFTSSGMTEFMNRSVYIYDGKITWICDGACPVMPLNALIGNFTGQQY